MRYAILLLPLILMGAGCVESIVERQADVLVDMALDGAEELNEQAPELIDASMDELFIGGIAQTNGVWTYIGNTLSSNRISFTTFFDTYLNLNATDDPHDLRIQNFDPLFDWTGPGEFFLWVDNDVTTDDEFFRATYSTGSLEEVALGGRIWLKGLNVLGDKELPGLGYRYQGDGYAIVITAYPHDEFGLSEAERIIQTLEFVE